jgi:hypothetical protein
MLTALIFRQARAFARIAVLRPFPVVHPQLLTQQLFVDAAEHAGLGQGKGASRSAAAWWNEDVPCLEV